MKKIGIVLLFICALFAILFELSGSDPDNAFSFRSYFQYVTENIEPFPTVNFEGDIISDFSQIVTYIFRLFFCVLDNLGVLLHGLFPVSWTDPFADIGENLANGWEAMAERHRKFWQSLLETLNVNGCGGN